MALIFDTGPLVALLDRDEATHRRCRSLVEGSGELLVIPSPVLPEVDYLLTRRFGVGPFLALLRDIAEGAFVVEDPALDDLARAGELMDSYGDAPVGYVDAAVLAMVERLGEPKLATLDRRHFTLMRPRHVEALELLPT